MAYNLLKGKRGIIFGALNEQSIAWKVAERAVEEGAQIVLTNAPIALRLGAMNTLAEKCNTIIIPADATSVEDLQNLVDKAMEHLGGKIDFVLYEKDAMAEYGSVVALSYIAAQRAVEGYSDMAEAKAMLESIARSFGAIYGRKRKVRVNTVSQSPTLTTAGQGIAGMTDMYNYTNDFSPLGNASADECADYVVTLFSDLTRKVTMQNLYHDGGYSTMGISADILKK